MRYDFEVKLFIFSDIDVGEKGPVQAGVPLGLRPSTASLGIAQIQLVASVPSLTDEP